MLAQMAGEFCQPLESKVVGLAGSRGIDDLGGLCAQQPRDALGGVVNDQFCVPACLMAEFALPGQLRSTSQKRSSTRESAGVLAE